MKDERHDPANERLSRRKFLGGASKGILATGALILSACAPRRSPAYSVKIQLTQNRSHFVPPTIEIPAGSKVVWQNLSIYPVTVTCDPSKVKSVSANHDNLTAAAYVNLPKDAAPFDSGALYPGQTWSYTFQTRGEYLYFSQFDQSPDLVGMIRVR